MSVQRLSLHCVCFSDICSLADKYNAMVFIDECHATGFFGATGRCCKTIVTSLFNDYA